MRGAIRAQQECLSCRSYMPHSHTMPCIPLGLVPPRTLFEVRIGLTHHLCYVVVSSTTESILRDLDVEDTCNLLIPQSLNLSVSLFISILAKCNAISVPCNSLLTVSEDMIEREHKGKYAS